MNIRRTTLLLGIAIAALLGILGTLIFIASSGDNVIVLTDNGFKPATLTITEGETVTFKNHRSGPFWPASNVHPTHTNFPDFDPRKPVDDEWSFTFTKPGTYRYHDHIVSTFEGEIIVERKDGTRVTIDCSVEQNQQCWEKMILEKLKVEGVRSAFETILNLSETEPGFANDCHGLSHLIGEEAYALYVAEENFEITPATALCGYGFFHGFMETMLLATGNVEEAREFCLLVDEKLRGQASSASTACYHGIGHGAIDGSDPTVWGDPEDMMEPGFKLCEATSENELERYLCDTGVFNAIELLSADPKYGLQEMREDPFAMCNEQPVFRREGCYANMVPLLLQTYKNDIQKILDYVNANMIDHDVIAIDGNTVNDLTTIGIMFEFIRLHGEEDGHMQEGIAFCRAQEEQDRLACIAGLSGGYMKYGEPGQEYVKNLEFCALPELTKEERDSCYGYALPRMSGRYDQATLSMICGQVDVEYRNKYCRQ